MSRPKIIISNWKMHGDLQEIKAWWTELFEAIQDGVLVAESDFELVVCLPFPYLGWFCGDGLLRLGGQACHSEAEGAYTGDVAAAMLRDLGVSYVLVGHSERRDKHAESNADVQAKAQAALKCGIVPIICVGESLDAHKQGKAEKIVCTQLKKSLPELKASDKIIIAYEPVWAIGSGRQPSRDEVQSMLSALRGTLREIASKLADDTPIIYGGSVTAKTVRHFFDDQADIDGVLVGNASRKALEFANIAKQVMAPMAANLLADRAP